MVEKPIMALEAFTAACDSRTQPDQIAALTAERDRLLNDSQWAHGRVDELSAENAALTAGRDALRRKLEAVLKAAWIVIHRKGDFHSLARAVRTCEEK